MTAALIHLFAALEHSRGASERTRAMLREAIRLVCALIRFRVSAGLA